MTDESVKDLTEAAEVEWLETWVEGPGDQRTRLLEPGTAAPEFDLFDEEGINRELASFWADGPALIMFWRHFGCGCGIDRASRLRVEYEDYVAAGLSPVIIGQGEPERAAAYKQKYEIPCTILCGPGFAAYDAYGLANFGIEQVLYDAPEEMWGHSMQVGIGFQAARRQMDRPLVDNPWSHQVSSSLRRAEPSPSATRTNSARTFPTPECSRQPQSCSRAFRSVALDQFT